MDSTPTISNIFVGTNSKRDGGGGQAREEGAGEWGIECFRMRIHYSKEIFAFR